MPDLKTDLLTLAEFVEVLENTSEGYAYICEIKDFHEDCDKYGREEETHTIGEVFLMQVANHLIENSRKNEIIARVGCDKFIILLKKDRILKTNWKAYLERCPHLLSYGVTDELTLPKIMESLKKFKNRNLPKKNISWQR